MGSISVKKHVCQISYTFFILCKTTVYYQTISKMLLNLILVFFSYFMRVSAIPMITYNNAYFNSIENQSTPTTLFPALSRNICICRCYNITECITGTFFGMNQTCVLSSARLFARTATVNKRCISKCFHFSK